MSLLKSWRKYDTLFFYFKATKYNICRVMIGRRKFATSRGKFKLRLQNDVLAIQTLVAMPGSASVNVVHMFTMPNRNPHAHTNVEIMLGRQNSGVGMVWTESFLVAMHCRYRSFNIEKRLLHDSCGKC